ncbi:MAG: hypothetical protein M3R13_10315 [Armatimonadota bacterium]|nr:hypothetical protein [Armatimonadota bacterium]
MLAALLPLMAIASVQDRVISVHDLIASFDTAEARYTAADELGKTIVYLHARGADIEAIKQKLATSLSAGWRRTDSGFRLERSSKQLSDLKDKEVDSRADAIRQYQEILRKKLTDTDTVEKRMSAALQSIVRFQEKYRNTSPGDFKWDTELPTDWVLFSAIVQADAKELASLSLQRGLELSNRPSGEQRGLNNQVQKALAEYERDRIELSDFAAHILDATIGGPMRSNIEQRITQAVKPFKLRTVIAGFARSSDSIGCGLYLYDDAGNIYDQSVVWIPTHAIPRSRIAVPASLTATYTLRQETFAISSLGFEYVKSPKPETVRPMIGVDPLVATEPLLGAVADIAKKPFLAVLDDRLLSDVGEFGGREKFVSQFVRKAEEHGLVDQVADEEWMLLRPKYLLDCEARRLNREELREFMSKTVDAGFVRIEDHARVIAASGTLPMNACLDAVFSFLNRSGYVLVKQDNYMEDMPCRVMAEIIRLRGERLERPIEIPVTSLSSSGKDFVSKWARRGVAALESLPGFSHSSLERNANEAMPGGIPADAMVRLTPYTDEFIGLLDNWPLSYAAETIATFCVWNSKTPEQFLTRSFHYGKRRAIKLEVIVRSGLVLQDSFAEAAESAKAMDSYRQLPAEFRQELDRAYEDAKRRNGIGGLN